MCKTRLQRNGIILNPTNSALYIYLHFVKQNLLYRNRLSHLTIKFLFSDIVIEFLTNHFAILSPLFAQNDEIFNKTLCFSTFFAPKISFFDINSFTLQRLSKNFYSFTYSPLLISFYLLLSFFEF